ncbi:short-chain dehydrogenase/reductase SDR [Rhodotorula toruloides]|uniref:Short-chain dehydrogenase/reductase SDR n=1 Tax=Rhodotorula toruloides TaxID=5286 RepID=A0A2S9ZWI4_RHOTO|nr:short-chain dehydrogenase/reductase SDR [Rhodotorula toruloides]
MAGRVALITGAGRGIGLSAAKLFLENGYRVFLSDVNLEQARKELSGTDEARIGFLETDVTKEDQVKAMSQAALKRFGQVDAAIVNAGILSPIVPWLESTPEDLDRMLDINVKGAWLTCKHAAQAMLDSPHKGKGGSIVFVASVASLYGQPGMSGYCASKWAVRGLSLTAAAEFAPHGIRSNCIQPGATDTAMFAAFPPDLQSAVTDSVPLKRAAQPTEIAEVMLFLAGEKSSFMNGSTVAVHGGQTPT